MRLQATLTAGLVSGPCTSLIELGSRWMETGAFMSLGLSLLIATITVTKSEG